MVQHSHANMKRVHGVICANVNVHGVTTTSMMEYIKKKYPDIYHRYSKQCKEAKYGYNENMSIYDLLSMNVYNKIAKHRTLAMMYTLGDKRTPETIESSLRILRKHCLDAGETNIYMNAEELDVAYNCGPMQFSNIIYNVFNDDDNLTFNIVE